jgi:DNA-binding PadR family transcriptional regulator
MSTQGKPAEVGVRLSAVSYVVLGLIGLRGASTPYQLKRAAERSIHYFWPFPHSQLYSEPARLAKAGLLLLDREDGGRRRVLYKLTDAGRDALTGWFQTPPGEVFEMRDMAVLQLFFSDFVSTEQLVALANDQIRLYRERLDVYRDIQRHNASESGIERRMAPLHLGIGMAQACLDFWSEIAANPPPPSTR